jgi:hypothetical protein
MHFASISAPPHSLRERIFGVERNATELDTLIALADQPAAIMTRRANHLPIALLRPPSHSIRIVCAKREISWALSVPSARSSPARKNIPLPFFRNSCFSPCHPASMRGANASSRTRGGDAMDALGSHDERRSRGRSSRVVLISRRWDQACG